MLNLYNIMLTGGSENLFYLAYGMPQSRTSRRADYNYIEISYASKVDGEFILYNAIGDIILKASLPKEYMNKKIQLNNIASALYHYEIHFADGEKQFGKLSILK